MKSVNDMVNESVSELNLESEQQAKDVIKRAVKEIISQQQVIVCANKKISEQQSIIKAVTITTVSTDSFLV